MNILLIGNGFDLAHGLPTKYIDCLNFLKIFKTLDEDHFSTLKLLNSNHFLNSNMNSYIRTLLSEDKRTKVDNELLTLVKDNIWIEYFLYKTESSMNRNGWIDFESEIADIIKCIKFPETNNAGLNDLIKSPYLVNLISKSNSVKAMHGLELFENIKLLLIEHLNNFTQCLAIYLSICMIYLDNNYLLDDIVKICTPDFHEGEINAILSFNYTDTFRRLYEPFSSTRYCYIHGQVLKGQDSISNNMVLGIDEYLPDNKRSNDLEFIQFKKYYQRIFKKTDYNYVDWINKPESANKLYIFGHSLDITDQDVLCELILNPNTQTVIYYFSKDQNAKQIANLVKVLGYNNMNILARHKDSQGRSIDFVQQSRKLYKAKSMC